MTQFAAPIQIPSLTQELHMLQGNQKRKKKKKSPKNRKLVTMRREQIQDTEKEFEIKRPAI